MLDKFWLALVALWIERIYFQDENWDRLRAIGQVKTLADGIEELIFFPLKQRLPGLDEQTHPEMKDPRTNQFLSSFNTVSDACDFMNEPYGCNVHREPSSQLGKKLKYLLRKSNNTYPHLFTDIAEVPSSFSILDRVPNKNPYFSYVPIMDIHAYDNSILIAGGPIANASDWPKDYQVKEVDYSIDWSYRGIVGENIVLPSTVDSEEFGELVKSVWKAKINSLSSIEN